MFVVVSMFVKFSFLCVCVYVNIYVKKGLFTESRSHIRFKGLASEISIWYTKLSSNISSTESDVNIRKMKAWIAIDRLSIR